MNFKLILILMSALFSSIFGSAAEKYKSDTIVSEAGNTVKFTFFAHASFMFEADGAVVYLDPVGQYADYGKLPKADVILITHNHGDHFDADAVKAVSKQSTQIYTTPTTATELGYGNVMRNGDKTECLVDNVKLIIAALPAHNTSAGREKFHPAGRDNGYIVEVNGLRIYVSGDSEPIPEMTAQKNIDVLFLSVNQPYTMTVEQAAEVVNTVKPHVFYPIHYGGVDKKTDLDKLKSLVEAVTDIRIMPME